MKKFFALMLVVAMLSVAGSAMAVTISVSGDKTVSVQAGKSAGFTLVVSLDHSDFSDSLSVDISSGTAGNWATSVTSTEVTFAVPSTTTAGTYPAVVRARERYISGDTTGHSILTDTATVIVSLDVTAAPAPTPDKKSETVTNVKVVNIKIAVVPTLTTQATIPTAITTAINNPTTQGVIRTVLSSLGITVPSGATPQPGSNMVAATTDNYDNSGTDAANQANLAKASAKLKKMSGGNTKRAIGAAAPFTVTNAGFQPIDMPEINSAFYNYPLGMVMGNSGTAAAFATADASGNSEVAFLNSLGQSVDKVPDASGSWTAGKVTAIAYVEPGVVYEPILTLTVSAASADSFDEESGTTTVATVEIIEPADTPVDPWGGKTYLIDIPQVSIDRIASIDGRTLRTLVAATVSAEPVSDTTLYNVGGVSKDVVASLPTLANIAPNAANEAYIMAFKYSRPTITGRTISGDPEFYPQGPTGDQKGRVYNNTGLAKLADIVTGNIGYIVFAVASNDTFASFYAANADFASPRVLATSVPVVPTPTPTYPEGTSSSSGGCSAGSAALALAVLGSFILTRKK